MVFQSTPPVKAATIISVFVLFGNTISIHSAREGGDSVLNSDCDYLEVFQSTPPVKAATVADELIDTLSVTFQSTPPVKAATAETYKCNQHFRKQQVRK